MASATSDLAVIFVSWALGLGILVVVLAVLVRRVQRSSDPGEEGRRAARRTLVVYSVASVGVLGLLVWRSRTGLLWRGPPPWSDYGEVRTAFRMLGTALAFAPLHVLSVAALAQGTASGAGAVVVRAAVWGPLLAGLLIASIPGCGPYVGCMPLAGLPLMVGSDPTLIVATVTMGAALVFAVPAERRLRAPGPGRWSPTGRLVMGLIPPAAVYAVVANLAPERADLASARARDAATGLPTAALLWSLPVGDSACPLGGGGAVGPDGTVYLPLTDGLTAVAGDGRVLWREPRVRGLDPPVVGPSGVIYARPSRFSPALVAVAPDGRYLDTVAAGLGSSRWNRPHRTLGPAVGSGDALFLTGGEAVAAFGPGGGVLALRTFEGNRVDDDGALSGPVLDPDGRLRVLDRTAGVIHALTPDLEPAGPTLPLDSADSAGLTPGPDGRILVTSRRGSGGSLAAWDREGRRLWTYDGMDGPPVVAADGSVWFVQEQPFGTRGHPGIHLTALAPDGTRRWARALPPGSRAAHDVQAGPFLLSDGSVLTVAGDVLSSIGPAGEYRWRATVPGDAGPLSGGRSTAWAVVGPDGNVYLLARAATGCAVIHALRPPGNPPPGLATEGWPAPLGDATNRRRYLGG